MEDSKVSSEHGAIYWFSYHTWQGIKQFVINHRIKFIILLVTCLVLAFLYRSFLQPLVLLVRLNLFYIFVPIAFIYLGIICNKRLKTLGIPALILMFILAVISIFYGRNIQEYVALYKQYKHVEQVELNELPESGYERIHPFNAIYSLAYEAMSETETPMKPSFVRIGNEYRWTMGIEPAHLWARTVGHISEIFNISATDSTPSFAKTSREKVDFKTGEELFLSHSARYAVIKTFGIWKYLNYEPSDVLYFTDDNGEWLQVVPLIRWRGLLFPRPEFGGLQIIRQHESSTLGLALFGAGEFLSPDEALKKQYLRGQNIMPLTVSRYMAKSFRFRKGFFAPLPWYHGGDVRIPDLPEDVNEQPFPGYFKIKTEDNDGMLYQYFGLEPYDVDKQGLSVSLFVPADTSPKVYVYKHYEKSDYTGSMKGVSAVAAKVMESKKEYDWERNRPVEHRPYIKNIDGKIRFFWLTTVVTFKDRDKEEGRGRAFITGSEPSIVLTDATYNKSIWVEPTKQKNWVAQIRDEMKEIWK